MGFVRPRELMSFDQRHVTRSPPLGKPFELEGLLQSENLFELQGKPKCFVHFFAVF